MGSIHRTTSRHPYRRLLVGLLSVAGLTACGSANDEGTPVPTTSSPPGLGPASAPSPGARERVIRALADRPEDMSGTARYSLRTLEAESGFVFFSAEGIADFDKERYRARVESRSKDDPALAPPAQEFFVSGTTVYELIPGRGWLTGTKPPFEIGTPLPLAPLVGQETNACTPPYANDRSVRTQIVETLVTHIESLGVQTLRSTATEHYRAHVDAARTAALPPELRAQLGSCGGEPTSDLDIDVWLEGDRLRQFSFTGTGGAVGAGIGFETEYWDYDRVPSPEVPVGLPAVLPP